MNRIFKHNLKSIITDLYQKGIPVAGTSAGNAIQSNPMLTGNGSETAEGLGLLEGIIVDQHFVVRAIGPRLLGALGDNPAYQGLDVDEDMSVVLHYDMSTALGPSVVIFYVRTDSGYQNLKFHHGESVVRKQ